MTDLIIAGAGGTARDIAEAVEAANRALPRWRLLGFLDDNPALAGGAVDGHPVLGPLGAAGAVGRSASFIIGVASSKRPGLRAALLERMGLGRERLASLAHPSAQVSERAEIGPGAVVLANAVIARGVRLGCGVIVCQNATVSHDSVIGDFADVAPGAVINGFVDIGAGAFIGANSAVMPSMRVGAGSIVGLGCVVQRDVPANSFVISPPIRAFTRPAG